MMKYRLNTTTDLFILSAFETNYIYVIHDHASNHTTVVDPGQASVVFDFLQEQGWSLDVILVTHHHADHVGGIKRLVKQYGCDVVAYAHDVERIPCVTRRIDAGESYAVGQLSAEIIANPGHTIGSITYYFPREQIAFVGDTIFAMGCGRLFEGTPAQMLASLRHLCEQLSPTTRLFNAHEYAVANGSFALLMEPNNDVLHTRMAICQKQRVKGQPCQGATLVMEQETNPFLRVDSLQIAATLGLEGQAPEVIFAELRTRRDHFVA